MRAGLYPGVLRRAKLVDAFGVTKILSIRQVT